MSKRVGDLFVVAVEPEGTCELCGKTDELRPYGPKGERICFECGMKNHATTLAQFLKVVSEPIKPTN